ncbi:protein vestigial-like [Amphibalanus amphitrite]|uniref:protein vestigial-like n=1 Tax=Amphibalanus amphitrite TaxID=1232801 RepID=UPI001C918E8C|nr:protein vestigial-like [Amphibalanus amphitrite]
MSCAVAMYQPFHAPYYPAPATATGSGGRPSPDASVVPAPAPAPARHGMEEKRQRLHEHLYRAGSGAASNYSLKPSPSSPLPTSASPVHEEEERRDVKYLSSSCMLVTNYSGNVSSVVDDHFTRALNVTTSDKAPVPMSQRNFPASFWNSNYHSRTTLTSHDLYSDPYHAASLAGLHQPADWYYPITSQAYGHNFSYGAGTSARYNQYPSLFLQSAATAGRLGMQQGHGLDPSSYSPYMYSAGLEGTSVPETATKDLHWFQ